ISSTRVHPSSPGAPCSIRPRMRCPRARLIIIAPNYPFIITGAAPSEIYTLSLHDALPIYDQIKEMTRKVSAEVDLVHQQTQNQRYGSSHIGATAKDISNVVTDAASGVVDIFHGIDKAVADTWNNFWKDGKADGIGS